ncbi:MAG: hypothetical protein GY858_04905 [Candidatus Omnitrophica bacterium]|nr:hypothetical protein [Candidatus Omnitrophota bacterium]
MKKVFILIFLLVFIGCSKNEDYFSDPKTVNCDKYGKKGGLLKGLKINECFAERFKYCMPATITSGFMGIKYHYEIVGPRRDGCLVRSRFLKNINPEYENKNMRCLYNRKLPFLDAVKDTSQCSGELYDLMYPRGSNNVVVDVDRKGTGTITINGGYSRE